MFSGRGSRRGGGCVGRSSGSGLRFLFDTELDAEHGAIEGRDRETESAPHAGFPTIREALFEQERGEVVHATAEESKERGGTIQERVDGRDGEMGEKRTWKNRTTCAAATV